MDVVKMRRCSQCSYEFERQFEIDHHVQRTHRNATEPLFDALATPEQFQCIGCAFKSFYTLDLYEHYKQKQHRDQIVDNFVQSSSNVATTTYYCCDDHCRFRSNSSLVHSKHQYLLHVDKKLRKKQKKDFQCTKCSHSTNRSRYLKRHMLTHASHDEITWFPCDKCSYKANLKCNLTRHMLTHGTTGENLFQCPKCACKTKHKSSLKAHILFQHTTTEWFQCSMCSYGTRRKGNLKRHMLKHASAKQIDWFPCTKCSHKSKRKRDLKTHMLKHAAGEDIVWFRCSECSFKTKYRSCLKNHVPKHGDRPPKA